MIRRILAASVALGVGAFGSGTNFVASDSEPARIVIGALTVDGDVALFDQSGTETARFSAVVEWSHPRVPAFIVLTGSRLVLNDPGRPAVVVLDVSNGEQTQFSMDLGWPAVLVPGSDNVVLAADYYGSDEALVVDVHTLTALDLADVAGAGPDAYFSVEGSRASPDGAVAVLVNGTTADSYLVSVAAHELLPIHGRPIAVTAKRIVTTVTDDGSTYLIRYSPDGVERSRVTIPWSRAFAELVDGGVVAVDDDGGVHRIDPDVTTVTRIGTVSMRSGEIPMVSAAFDGDRIAVAYGGGVETIRLDDASPGQTIAVENGTPGISENIGGDTRCTWFEIHRGTVLAADLESGQLVDVAKGDVSESSEDGCTFVLAHYPEPGTTLFHNGVATVLPDTARVLALSPDGTQVIVADAGVVRVAPTDDPMGGVVLRVDGVQFAFL